MDRLKSDPYRSFLVCEPIAGSQPLIGTSSSKARCGSRSAAEYRNLFAGLLATSSAERKADGSSTRVTGGRCAGTRLTDAPFRGHIDRKYGVDEGGKFDRPRGAEQLGGRALRRA